MNNEIENKKYIGRNLVIVPIATGCAILSGGQFRETLAICETPEALCRALAALWKEDEERQTRLRAAENSRNFIELDLDL